MIPSMVDAPGKHFFLKYIEMLKKQEILWWRLHIEKALWKGNRSCKKDTRSGDQRKSHKRENRCGSNFT
jgi:hypothetical protein